MGEKKLIYKVNVNEEEGLAPEEVISRGLEGFRNVVQVNSVNEMPIHIAKNLINDPDLVFNNPLSVLIDHNDKESKVLVQESFDSLQRKVDLLKLSEVMLCEHTKKKSLVDELLSVADEMLTNAVFNAPFAGQQSLKRDSNSDLLKNIQAADYFLGKDSENFVVGCVDHYGKIDVENLLHRIKNCYENTVADSINMTKDGGAGIGTYMIYNSSSSLLVGVLPGKKTIFCSFFPIKGSNRQRAEKPKSLYLIY